MPAVQRELSYLVIGAMASETWADMDFSKNIEQAVALQDQGSDITIIEEKIWTRHLRPDPA